MHLVCSTVFPDLQIVVYTQIDFATILVREAYILSIRLGCRFEAFLLFTLLKKADLYGIMKKLCLFAHLPAYSIRPYKMAQHT